MIATETTPTTEVLAESLEARREVAGYIRSLIAGWLDCDTVVDFEDADRGALFTVSVGASPHTVGDDAAVVEGVVYIRLREDPIAQCYRILVRSTA
jgi:hypothetical protein